MKYIILTAIAVLSLTAPSQSQTSAASSAPPKNDATKKKAGANKKKKAGANKNAAQAEAGAPESGAQQDKGKYLVSIVPFLKPVAKKEEGHCALLPQADNRFLTTEDVAQLIGEPTPFSVESKGARQILIYSTRPLPDADSKDPKTKDDRIRLNEIKGKIEELKAITKFDVELTVPHARALGDVAAKVNGLNYDSLTVKAVGPDKIRVTGDSAPDCDVWTQFLTNVRHIAWRPYPVSPVERIFYLNGSDVSTALSGAGGSPGDGVGGTRTRRTSRSMPSARKPRA